MNQQWLEQNVAVLRERHPNMAVQVINYVQQVGQIPLGKDNKNRFNIRLPDLNGKPQWLYPETLDRDLVVMKESISRLPNPQVLVWIGLGLGYHLLSYGQHPHPLNRFNIIFEPSLACFVAFLSTGDRRSLFNDRNVLWLVGVTADRMQDSIRALIQHPEIQPSLHLNTIIDLGFSPSYAAVAKEAWQETVDNIQDESQVPPYDSYLGWQYFMDNFNQLYSAPLLNELKNKFKGMPGIVISPGPSLKHSIEYLKTLQDKAVTFCGDSGLSLLYEAGIFPHFTGCMERKYASVENFKKIPEQKSVLIAAPVTHPQVYATHGGPCLNLARSNQFLSWLFPKAETHNVPISSVSHLGLYALWLMGCSPIYLIGQDLAFDPDSGMSHSEGHSRSSARDQWLKRGFDMHTVPGNANQPVETVSVFCRFRRHLTAIVNQLEIECINVIPERYGIAIPGTRRIEVESFLSSSFNQPVSVSEKINEIISSHSRENKSSVKKDLLEKLSSASLWLDWVINHAIELSTDVYNFDQSQSPDKWKKFFMKIEEKTARIMQDDRYHLILGPLTQTRHFSLAAKSQELMAAASTPEIRMQQCSVPLAWMSEIITRAELVQRRIKKEIAQQS